MSFLSSSAPLPDPRREPNAPQPDVPKPSVVPPKEPGKRSPAKWLVPLALVAIAGGVAFYLKTQSAAKTGGGGPIVTVPVVTVVAGDLNRTVRVTGTVFGAVISLPCLAPRIQGSRSNTNRGGMGGYGLAGPPPGGGPGPDFNLVLLHLIKAGSRVKKDDVVAEFDPTNQLLRLDDYKDSVVQTEQQIRKLIANLAANKEAHDQTVRAAKATWDQAMLDLAKAPVQAAIDAENAKLTAEQVGRHLQATGVRGFAGDRIAGAPPSAFRN